MPRHFDANDFIDNLEGIIEDTGVGWNRDSRLLVMARFLASENERDPKTIDRFFAFIEEAAEQETRPCV